MTDIDMRGYWRNRKSGDLYLVIDMAVDQTNGRENTLMVLYIREKANRAPYVRDADEFGRKFRRSQ